MTQETLQACAKRLFEQNREGALATLDENGNPLTTLVTYAASAEGRPLLLLSQLARHTQNLKRNARGSLLITDVFDEDDNADMQARARASLNGTITPLTDATAIADARARFLARHPASETYVDFPDFNFYVMTVADIHLVQGFGRINSLPGDALAA